MLYEIEYDLKLKQELLLEELKEMYGLTTNMSGNLEVALYIMRNSNTIPKTPWKKVKISQRNFQLIEQICRQLQELITKAEKVSFEHVKSPEPKNKENETKPKNNIIIFPLEQNDTMYVYPEEKLGWNKDED